MKDFSMLWDFTILYTNPESSRDLGMGLEFVCHHSEELYVKLMANILSTHVPLATIRVQDLNEIYLIMQGENWSSGGRESTAQAWIKQLDLSHTSMSVGDLVIDNDTGHVHFCNVSGWFDMGHFSDLVPQAPVTHESYLQGINRDLIHINDLYPIKVWE